MSSVLNDLGVTVWKQRNGTEQEAESAQIKSNEGELARANLATIVLDKVAFTKYQARDSSILKFINQLSQYLAQYFSAINVSDSIDENSQLSFSFNGNNETTTEFYKLEQVFLYPERKKSLFTKLAIQLNNQDEY